MCVVALLAATCLFGFSAYERLNTNIARVDVDQLLGTDRPTQTPIGGDPWAGQARNILVIGSDTRAGQKGIDDKYNVGHRSDTIMVVHLAANRKRADVISIPRDSVVALPACPLSNGKTTYPVTTRINTAYSIGGTACVIKAVETLTDLRINNYVVVDFNGFRTMVKALGGLEVCLPEAMNDDKAGLHVHAGRQRMSGSTALAYVRARYAEGDGSDLGRLDRQHAFLAAVVHQVTTMNLFTDAPTLYSFLDAATKSITTDPELGSISIMARLANSVQKIPQSMINYETVPVVQNPADPNTVVWESTKSEALWSALKRDVAPPGAPKPHKKKSPATGTSSAAPKHSTSPKPSPSASTAAKDSIICPN